MNCPVCNASVATDAVHCGTCNWYIPLKDTEHYDFELSRARQQWQMVSSFNQVFQHLQVQSKVLEKMSFRLDGLEADMQRVKDQNFITVNPDFEDEEVYPDLPEGKSAAHFDTPEKRMAWWESLEEQWQKAFNMAFFNKGDVGTLPPSDEELIELFRSPSLRIVGPRGMYPNCNFELTNLTGVKYLTNLEGLFITHGALVSLDGVEYLQNLESLFVNSNKLTNIKAVHYLPKLRQFYCNGNQLTSLIPLKNSLALETIYCNYNQLQNLYGITSKHAEHLKELYCLPNDQLKPKELKRIEEGIGIKCLKG